MAGRIEIQFSQCKGCGYCALACRQGAVSLSGGVNASGYVTARAEPEKCTGCGLCYTVCPDYAITVYKEETAGHA